MWIAIAEEDIRCTECYHTIPAGTDCLSQMPVPMPDGFRRRKYDNFCLECPECNENRRKSPCYVRYLGHWYARKEKTPGPANCVNCGDAIPKGTQTVAQKLYFWPERDDVLEQKDGASYGGSGVDASVRAAGIGFADAAKRAGSGAWQNLSPKTQQMFKTRGLGRGLGSRTPVMAQRFYETSVPQTVRAQGEAAVLKFLSGKHASHIKSISKMPGWAKRPSNTVWENSRANLKRGSRNMGASEVSAVQTANRASALGAVAKGAAKGGGIAAAIEAPVAAIENLFHWKRGRKSRAEAAKDAAVSTAGAAAVGAGATVAVAGIAKGAALVGISPTLGPAAPAVAAAGATLMVGTAAYRIYKAVKRDLPLDEYRVYFCKKTRCRKKYAQQVTTAALDRGERNYAWTIGIALAGLVTALIAVVAWLM